RARVSFEQAMEVAQTAGDLEGAGRAKLSIIEELGKRLSIEELISIYLSAIDLLKGSQDPSTAKRLIACAAQLLKLFKRLKPQLELADTWEEFKQQVRAGEKAVIARALRAVNGKVTAAAHKLGFKHHQSLITIIESRHPELLPQ